MINTSSDGAFIVIGSNTVQDLDLISWSQELSKVVEKAVGIKTPYGVGHSVKIMVENGDPAAPGRVLIEEQDGGGNIALSLRIFNYDRVDVAVAGETMCKLLLKGYVLSCRDKGKEADSDASLVGRKKSADVPQWFYCGMARYINQDQRPDDAESILMRWRRGHLKTLPEMLDSEPEEKAYHCDAAYAMIIAWLQTLPDKSEFFGKMFGSLDSGEKLSSEWFVKNIPGCNSVSDLSEEWENWLTSQLKVIHKPGVATPLSVDQLKERLVIRPDDIGMPSSSNITTKITFDELINAKIKEVPWLPLVLQNKTAELKLFAVGRGKELNQVVESYCTFLDAVARGKRQGTLLKYLQKAKKDLAALETKVGVGNTPQDDK